MRLGGKRPQMTRQLELPLANRGEARREAERGSADGDAWKRALGSERPDGEGVRTP